MVRDWQVDPFSGRLLHVDLFRIAMDVRMKVMVPVHTFGEAQGVKLQGGVYEIKFDSSAAVTGVVSSYDTSFGSSVGLQPNYLGAEVGNLNTQTLTRRGQRT